MLTRLKVTGFKNLVNVDIRFGPFTCIAGANATGKSNLFDAIRFLSLLADRPLLEAAMAVRDETARMTDVRNLFHRLGDKYSNTMSFEAEMIVPEGGRDDLGQNAKATITFLRYSLDLGYRQDFSRSSGGPIEVLREELQHIRIGDAHASLPFKHSLAWRKSVVKGQRRAKYFISTVAEGRTREVRLHQDGGGGGRPLARTAADLLRTVISGVNAAESPTALLARREMASWRLLQLEPAALRKPDEFTAPTRLGTDGSHLPATLYHLARLENERDAKAPSPLEERQSPVYARLANRLSQLIDDVSTVWIERDEKRELLSLYVEGADGTAHPAKALSDGTLRFLALAVIETDKESGGVLCLEEPENGIHPPRIPAMLRLLQDIATDPQQPTGEDNPLRQVIVNTHSPVVVSLVPDDSLLVAELKETVDSDADVPFQAVRFSYLPDTWRARVEAADNQHIVPKGELLKYLNPVPLPVTGAQLRRRENGSLSGSQARRVVDRRDLQALLPGFEGGR